MSSILPKNEQKISALLVCVLEELKTPKRHLEINWPLDSENKAEQEHFSMTINSRWIPNEVSLSKDFFTFIPSPMFIRRSKVAVAFAYLISVYSMMSVEHTRITPVALSSMYHALLMLYTQYVFIRKE